MYAELEQRLCRTCGKMKDKKEFHRISRGKVTTQPDCKVCRSEKEFERGLMRFYGITVAFYNELSAKQNDRCACCSRHKSEFKRRLHVDHKHGTKIIRGLLCTLCNPLIGYAKESIENLQLAAVYLNKVQEVEDKKPLR